MNAYRFIFQQSPDALFFLAHDLSVVDSSEQAARIARVKREDMIGQPIVRFFPEEADTLEASHHQAIKMKTSVHFSGPSMVGSISPLSDQAGVSVGTLLQLRHKRRNIHNGALDGELSRIVENLYNVIFTYSRNEDGDFVMTMLEGKLAKECGLTHEKQGIKLQDALKMCNEADLMPYFEKAFTGEMVEYESSIGDRTFFTTLSPVSKDGEVVEVVGSTTDITERKQMEQALQEAELLYRSLVENTLVGVYIAYVEDKGFVYVNPRMADIFGYDQTEIVEMSAVDLVIPEDREVVRMNQRRRMNGDRSRIVHQFRGLRKDGSVISVEVIQNTMTYKGKPAVIGMLLDTTDRRHAEEMVRKSEMLSVIGQLAAGVAHEIRNPLTSLKGFVQLLDSHVTDKREYLSIMLSELNRIEYIIREFLVLAKPQDVVYQKRDVRPMLEHIIALGETHAILHSVEIQLAIAEADLPPVNCEENQLKQVFLNLLKNAIEAMPQGGQVRVEVLCEQDETIVVRIVDQGCGIPEEKISKLGEPFFTTKETGTGLGLMVSYKIIHNHGGTITVKSREQQGTTFEIRLPAFRGNDE